MPFLPIRTHIIVAIELGAFLALLVLAALWTSDPSGPYEPFTYATGLVFVATEAVRRYEGKLFRVEGVERTPSERVKHHEVLRIQFEEHIAEHKAKNLRKDVILRHVNRIDSYPNAEPGPGISPWFKVGLIDTYHMGIKIGLGWHGLKECDGGLRKADYKSGEKGDVTAMLTGEIPYDYIETMNPRGDEYYYIPHIFCHFANRGEPYARLFYTQEIDVGHGHSYWKEISTYGEVEAMTKKHRP
ncbi:MAG: hypothetical protein Q7J75_01925 [Rhodoferax sp.]|nr:hypothetical protein [Rhodoferax sp.]